MIIKRILSRLTTELSIYMPLWNAKENDKVIVSLTSYPARLPKLHIVIKSLLRQTMHPGKILLWLGEDTKESDITKKLRTLEKKSKGYFEIRTGCENIRPHKKYFYAMQEFSDKAIITVDDDLIYDKNLVRDLWHSYEKYQDCVSARRVNLMTKNEDGELNEYNDWKWEYKKELKPSFALLPTGCGGVLYPPHILPENTFDLKAIKEHCLNTDDIWLKFMELKNSVKVVFTNSKVVHPLTLRGSQKTALMHSNAEAKTENRNDINIRKMQNFTGLYLKDYC